MANKDAKNGLVKVEPSRLFRPHWLGSIRINSDCIQSNSFVKSTVFILLTFMLSQIANRL